MKKIIPTVLILTFALLASPSQTYAAWWNPASWFSNDIKIEEQKQPQNATSSGTDSKQQTANQNVGAIEKQDVIAPVNNPQSSDTKTIAELKAEVATLKTNLDSLYKAHNGLVEDHNALQKYVNATISSNKNIGTATNNSNLEGRVTDLEGKLNDACSHIFNGSFGSRCPSATSFSVSTLEGRIEKLERGF